MMNNTEVLVTRTGPRFLLRLLAARDESLVADLFRQVTSDDLRFRFLSGVRVLGHDRFLDMLGRGDGQVSNFLAFDEQREVIAAATFAGDDAAEHCEVAIVVRADRKGRGVGWTLLDYLVSHARNAGYVTLESIESRYNAAAIALQTRMGFTTETLEGEATLVQVRRRLQ